MHNQNLTYGIKDGKLTHISEVEKGLKCDCICSFCGEELIARKGEQRAKHFAHKSGADCVGAYESALHLLAKEVLLEKKRFYLPSFRNFGEEEFETIDFMPFKLKSHDRLIVADKVVLEKDISEGGLRVKPDAIIEYDGREIYIEFANTHFVDLDKEYKLLKLNKECIEVDIRDLELDRKKVAKFLKNDFDKYWVVNNKTKQEFEARFEKYILALHQKICSNIICLPSIRIPNYIEESSNKPQYYYDEISRSFRHGNEEYKDIMNPEIFLADSEKGRRYIQENKLEGVKCDAILFSGNRSLLIKFSIYQGFEKGLDITPAIEDIELPLIVFSFNPPEVICNDESIKNFLITQDHGKTWLRNPKGEKRIKEFKEKKERLLENYQNDEGILTFEINDLKDRQNRCSKKASVYSNLKKEHFYSHSVVKRILDGLYWNKKIYGKGDFGKTIYLNNKKVVVYPSEYGVEEDAFVPKGSKDVFFKGLKTIQEAYDYEIGACKYCDYLIKELRDEVNNHFICGYNKLNKR